MVLTDSLRAYTESKRFTLKYGHAVAAYIGFVHGLDQVDQALKNEEILEDVRGALKEGGAALLKKQSRRRGARAVRGARARSLREPEAADDVERDRLSGQPRW